jgi:hypothetical protein
VIVVVEGPSGSGKTTWCRAHGGRYALLESLPDHATVPSDPTAEARFWVERNVARWEAVRDRERRDGLVVVDTDPFKLHYIWTLWRSGQTSELAWGMHREVAREAFAMHRYALADLFLVADIDDATLRSRRGADTTRTRRNFERHVRLRDSLLAWYAAIDRLDPGRVIFGLPDHGLPAELVAKGPRAVRSGSGLFAQLLAELEAF